MRTGVQGAGCDEDTDEGKCGWREKDIPDILVRKSKSPLPGTMNAASSRCVPAVVY